LLANVDQLPQVATPTLYCDIAGQFVERKLAPLKIAAEQTVSLSPRSGDQDPVTDTSIPELDAIRGAADCSGSRR
jgi:hypothetical protein